MARTGQKAQRDQTAPLGPLARLALPEIPAVLLVRRVLRARRALPVTPADRPDLPALRATLARPDLPDPPVRMDNSGRRAHPDRPALLVNQIENDSILMMWWQSFAKAFSPAECATIKAYALALPPRAGAIGHGGTTVTDENMRRSQVRWLRRDDPVLYWLYSRIESMALDANSNGFGFDLCGLSGGFNSVQFTEYAAENSGHYNWHEDNAWKGTKPFDRKMSMVIQLSAADEYEGGKLELHNDPLPEGTFTTQGDVLFFPSFNRHRVSPVTSGVRYSLVTWFMGPKLR